MPLSVSAFDESNFNEQATAVARSSGDGLGTYAQMNANLQYSKAGDDPFNDAHSFCAQADEKFKAAEVMPVGYFDTQEDRDRALEENPRDDGALLAPRHEDFEDFFEAGPLSLARTKALSRPLEERETPHGCFFRPPIKEEECYGPQEALERQKQAIQKERERIMQIRVQSARETF